MSAIIFGVDTHFASCMIHRPLVCPTDVDRANINSSCYNVSYYTCFIPSSKLFIQEYGVETTRYETEKTKSIAMHGGI